MVAAIPYSTSGIHDFYPRRTSDGWAEEKLVRLELASMPTVLAVALFAYPVQVSRVVRVLNPLAPPISLPRFKSHPGHHATQH